MILERTTVSLCTVVGAKPHLVRSEHGWDLVADADEPAFLVTRNPAAAPLLGPSAFHQMAEAARRHDWPVFQAGRSIVYVFNRAWDCGRLLQDLLAVLVDSQHNRIPAPEHRGAGHRLRRKLRRWIASLLAAPIAPSEGDAAPAAAAAQAHAARALAPAPQAQEDAFAPAPPDGA